MVPRQMNGPMPTAILTGDRLELIALATEHLDKSVFVRGGVDGEQCFNAQTWAEGECGLIFIGIEGPALNDPLVIGNTFALRSLERATVDDLIQARTQLVAAQRTQAA